MKENNSKGFTVLHEAEKDEESIGLSNPTASPTTRITSNPLPRETNMQIMCTSVVEFLPFLFLKGISTIDDISRSYLISKLGTDAVAAGVWIDIFEQFTAGMNDHVSAIINLTGKTKIEEDHCEILRASYVLVLISSVVAIIPLSFVSNILNDIGQNDAAVTIASDFTQVYKWGAFAIMLCVANRDFIIGSTNIVKKFTIWRTNLQLPIITLPVIFEIINLVIDRAIGSSLIDSMQIKGIAIASFVSAAITFILYSIFMNASPAYSNFNFLKRSSKLCENMGNLLGQGGPICIQTIYSCLLGFAVASFLGKLSVYSLAAYGVVIRYTLIPQIFVAALGNSTNKVVSQLYGNNDPDGARRFVKNTMYFNLVVIALVCIIFFFASKQLTSLFINIDDPKNQNVVRHCDAMFKIICVYLIFNSLESITNKALQGLEKYDARCSTIIRAVTLGPITVGVGCLFAFVANWNVEGFLAAQALSVIVSFAANFYLWRKRIYESINNPRRPIPQVVSEEGAASPRTQKLTDSPTVSLFRDRAEPAGISSDLYDGRNAPHAFSIP